jgi:hypothetical protein
VTSHELYDGLMHEGLNYLVTRLRSKAKLGMNTHGQITAVEATKLFSYEYTNIAFRDTIATIENAQIAGLLDKLR